MIIEHAQLLKPNHIDQNAVSQEPDRKNKIDHWAAPEYWAEVAYSDITANGLTAAHHL